MGSKNVIGELLGGGRGSQADLARNADLAKSTVSKAVNGGGIGTKAAYKCAEALGVDGAVLQGATNLAAALKALEESEADEPDTLERIGRIVRTLGKSGVDEDTPGLDELLTAIEDALEELSGAAVDSVRGTKPGSKGVATKGMPIHSAFDQQIRLTTKSADAADYDSDLEAGTRDLWGRRLDSRRLRDDSEHGFEDPSAYGVANITGDYDDEDLEGRDFTGKRVRPMHGRL